MVQRKTKYVQDASEKYAVFLMEKLLEDIGLSINEDSEAKYAEYVDYLMERNLTENEVSKSDYVEICTKQLPVFIERITKVFPGQRLSVKDVEKENRNKNKKADFEIYFLQSKRLSFSLKNYAGGIDRPQVRAGTFNSLVMNLLFDSPSVGMYTYEERGNLIKFKGSNVVKRNEALRNNGHSNIIEFVGELDRLQEKARSKILDDPKYRMFDEEKWKSLCVEIGTTGAEITQNICKEIGYYEVARRLLDLSGLISDDEILFISPNQILDSVTNVKFRALKESLQKPDISISCRRSGQTLAFEYAHGEMKQLRIDIPFTLNRNGAYWLDLPRYSGTRPIKDKRHIVNLMWGERRPYKSRELATSINTYIDLKGTGVLEL